MYVDRKVFEEEWYGTIPFFLHLLCTLSICLALMCASFRTVCEYCIYMLLEDPRED